MARGGDITGLARVIPPAADPMMLELMDRLGRQRALSEDESKLVEILVRRTSRTMPRRLYQWTKDDNRELLRVQHRPGAIQAFADKRGMTYKAAFQQLSRLRKVFRGSGASEMVDG